ncbi:MAG: glutaredoxin family protein [Gammaproteobacteria bacterium]|nr:glutaredoxin family protein [Gammaproteobacteria bacterium]
MKTKYFALHSAALFLLAMISHYTYSGELHKWIDANGQVHYGETVPADQQEKNIEGKVSNYGAGIPGDMPVSEQKPKTPKVIMYSTSWCGVCKTAKHFFQKNNIAYSEYDIETSAVAAQEYQRLNGRGVPLILVGEQRMSGFSPSHFMAMYQPKAPAKKKN